jgi:hypothetical protein
MTIANDDVLSEAHGLMVGHREEAQCTLDKELKAGMPPLVALAKAGRAIRAAQRAQIMHLAELQFRAA